MISSEQSIPNQFKQPKPKGGRRPGAGRKPSTLKGIRKRISPLCAEMILREINANEKLKALSDSKDESIRLQTIKFLWEQAYGKPKQKLEHSGSEGGPLQANILVKFVSNAD